jgi:hypothetical protein
MAMPIQKVYSALGDGEANQFLAKPESKDWELYSVIGIPSGEEGVVGTPSYIFVKRQKSHASASFT